MYCIVQGYLSEQQLMTDFVATQQVTTQYTKLFSIDVTNKNAATVWVSLWNSSSGRGSLVAYGTYPVPTNSTLSLTNRIFQAGLFVDASLTVGGAAITDTDLKICASYETKPSI